MIGGDSSGWQKGNSPDVTKVNPLALAETAARKAIESASPIEIPREVHGNPGACGRARHRRIHVLDYSGMSILDQRSFLTGESAQNCLATTSASGRRCTSSANGCAVDGEGVQRKRSA